MKFTRPILANVGNMELRGNAGCRVWCPESRLSSASSSSPSLTSSSRRRVEALVRPSQMLDDLLDGVPKRLHERKHGRNAQVYAGPAGAGAHEPARKSSRRPQRLSTTHWLIHAQVEQSRAEGPRGAFQDAALPAGFGSFVLRRGLLRQGIGRT